MFISFEGIDGSGKSTQISLLATWLQNSGYKVMTLREPGGTMLSEAVRGVLLSSKNVIMPRAELLLFEAARAQLVETVIHPALADGYVVICDRFADSSTAYQGFGRGLPVDDVRLCNSLATGGLVPDLTIFLDISPVTALERTNVRQNGNPDRMEKSGKDFFDRVRYGYLTLAGAEPDRFTTINAEKPVEYIHTIICAKVRDLMNPQ